MNIQKLKEEDVEGSVITADAMSCRRTITAKITEDYREAGVFSGN
jgi:predicted transposase YbfD/YdcC